MHSISLVGHFTGAVVCSNGSIHVTYHQRDAVAMGIFQSLNAVLHFSSASKGFMRAARWPVGAEKEKIGIGSLE